MSILETYPVAISVPLTNPSIATSLKGKIRDRSSYLFADNTRFFSMAAVVAIHSISVFGNLIGVNPNWHSALVQPFKFGTIGFFLISGFLMGISLNRTSPADYMKRRLKNVFAPWLIWFSLVFLCEMGRAWIHRAATPSLFLLAGASLFQALFGTAFWFIPNLLLSVGILLLCRRFLFDLRLGAAFLAISSFYALNLYFNWLPLKSHTEAFLGFNFYLWLGAWAARNFSQVEVAIERIPAQWLITAAILVGMLALGESFLLYHRGLPDPSDTLRAGNQLYSVVVVILIFKLHRPIALLDISIRDTTFGIYLTHFVVLLILLKVASLSNLHGFIIGSHLPRVAVIAVVLIVAFLATYSISVLATRFFLAVPRFRWIVGGDALSASRSHQNT